MVTKELEATFSMAVEEAVKRRHEHVTLEHLLFALLSDNITVAILKECAADLHELRQALDMYLSEMVEKLPTDAQQMPELTLSFRNIVEYGIIQAQGRGHGKVNGGDILAAIFQAKRSYALHLLKLQKVSLSSIALAQSNLNADVKQTKDQKRKLSVFLCHSSNDKLAVRALYSRLIADGITPWLDEEDLLPGEKWEIEIPKAVRNSDVVLVCLSQSSINKKGYLQKEIRYALDAAQEQPEGTIYLIPLKLEECDIPEHLRIWQWVNFFEKTGYEKLIMALRRREESLNANSIV